MKRSTANASRNLPLLGIALLLLLVTPLLSRPVAAQPPGMAAPEGAFGPGGPGAPGDGPGKFLLPRIAEYLDLTDAQIAQAKALLEEMKADGEPLREEAQAVREELQSLLEGDSPDPAAVGTRVIRLHELADEGRALREAFEESFAAILTADQLERWELAKDLRGLFGHGPGRGPGRGPGQGGRP